VSRGRRLAGVRALELEQPSCAAAPPMWRGAAPLLRCVPAGLSRGTPTAQRQYRGVLLSKI
jgi:hypothetical protein